MRPARGVALLGLLLVLAVLAIGQLLVLEQWSVARQREREEELLFAGEQFRRALASYARLTPAGSPPAPATLEDLLADRRFPRPVAHLRRLWPDPFTGRADWVLIRAGGHIVGLHSRATVVPFRQGPAGVPPREGETPATVADWRFVLTTAIPGATAAPPAVPEMAPR